MGFGLLSGLDTGLSTVSTIVLSGRSRHPVYHAGMKRLLLTCCIAGLCGLLAGCRKPANDVLAVSHPILFATQVPPLHDDASRLSAFANHLTGADQVPRGGGLMLRYPDGSLRNLTQEAGFGNAGLQGEKAIAVREPSMHWSGTKAVFSMVVGAATGPGFPALSRWQLWEVTGLGQTEKADIRKLGHQPEGYNNVSPIYGTDDRVLFTSDRPRNGQAHLYPQLDEYNALPSVSGLWSLDTLSGDLKLLTHATSGAFTPSLDSFGRVVFTRWDHLQQDRLAERDRNAVGNGVAIPFGSFNYADESAKAAPLNNRNELFPESMAGSNGSYGRVNAFTSNFFAAWQIREDGTGEETLNHVGLHELSFGFLTPSFRDDPDLTNRTDDQLHANRVSIRRQGGLFHLREDPLHPGDYFATNARESDSFTTDRLVKLRGAPTLQGAQMEILEVTAGDPGDHLSHGRYRNPLPLSDGRLIASHTTDQRTPELGSRLENLRLKLLQRHPNNGLYQAGPALTPGIYTSVSWWSGDQLREYKGMLWELEAVEVMPRARPQPAPNALEPPERAVLDEERVSEDALRAWLVKKDLALVVTRDQTSRDQADRQQPFNLQVPGGTKTISNTKPNATLYDITHFQIFQADLTRAYADRAGRRAIAQPIPGVSSENPANARGPVGSVKIARDGSTAAFVPARRALTWQSTDAVGEAIVRERNWITLQPGEIRTCASCHGVNKLDQAGLPAPTNKPEALRALLRHWKALPPSQNIRRP